MTSRGRSSGEGLREARERDLVVVRVECCCAASVAAQFFQPKLKLFELTVQLIARAAENHPPVLLDDQFQMFDLRLWPSYSTVEPPEKANDRWIRQL